MYKLSIKFFISKNTKIWSLSKLDNHERATSSNLKGDKKIKDKIDDIFLLRQRINLTSKTFII